MQSKLHLLIWDRFAPTVHRAKMKAFKQLAQKSWAKDIQLMLRPLGRPPETYFLWQFNRTFEVMHGLEHLRGTQVLPGGRTGHCEMWIQLPEELEDQFEHWLMGLGGLFFWNHKSPVWQPLGEDLFDCQYLRKREGVRPDCVYENSGGEAESLKQLWADSTRRVLDRYTKPLDPKKDWRRFRTILDEVLGGPKDSYDQTQLAVSHLSAFAVNALVEPWDDNKAFLEDFYDSGYVTRPHLFKDLKTYLKHINGRKFKMPTKKSSTLPKHKPGQGKKKPAPKPTTKKK